MRNFVPRLTLYRSAAQNALTAKLGGLPWGLPAARWPICRECGEPMSLLAQLPVRDGLDHADLLRGRDDLAAQVLHIFKCERDSICSFWEPHGGANAAFFLPCSELRDGLTAAPDPKPPMLDEVWIEGWVPHDDIVTEEQAPLFTDYDAYWRLPDEVASPDGFECRLRTKIGGVPYWTGNGPSEDIGAPFRYLLQIDQFLKVPDCETESLVFGNFCSDGTGYLFVDLDSPELPCLFVINR